MTDLTRRRFLATSAGTLALAASGFRKTVHAAETIEPPAQVDIGKTGIRMSRVGQGTGMYGGNRQSNHTRLGFEKLVALLRHSYERGITFFDLADLYGSHVYFREALRSIPRDKVAILTKIWWRYDGSAEPAAPEYMKNVARVTIDRFCHEIATDHLDFVLLHCLTTPKWTEQLEPYMAALDDAKKRGQVRAVGVSCHNLEAVDVAASSPWVDVILARLNPFGAKMDGSVEDVVQVLTKARKNGKAILGMKIYGEGTLVDKKEECIKYAQENRMLDAMTIGAESPEQMDETLSLISKYPQAELVS